eukprot:350725-Alexandrium_andersonii.AAC.1
MCESPHQSVEECAKQANNNMYTGGADCNRYRALRPHEMSATSFSLKAVGTRSLAETACGKQLCGCNAVLPLLHCSRG